MMIGYRHPPLFTHEHGCVKRPLPTVYQRILNLKFATFMLTRRVGQPYPGAFNRTATMWSVRGARASRSTSSQLTGPAAASVPSCSLCPRHCTQFGSCTCGTTAQDSRKAGHHPGSPAQVPAPGQPALDQLALDQLALDQLALDQLALDQPDQPGLSGPAPAARPKM